MFTTVRKFADYSKLVDDQMKLTFHEGYDFLNSKRNEEIVEGLKCLEKNLIAFEINRHQLSRIHKLFYEEHDNREYEIIKNVYNSSRKNRIW